MIDIPIGGVIVVKKDTGEGCKECFFYLKEEKNDKRGYPWISNPWVWVIDFKRIEKGIKEVQK